MAMAIVMFEEGYYGGEESLEASMFKFEQYRDG